MSRGDKDNKDSEEKIAEKKERRFMMAGAAIFLAILFVNAAKDEPWKDKQDAEVLPEQIQQIENTNTLKP